jgi:hypothetical protein
MLFGSSAGTVPFHKLVSPHSAAMQLRMISGNAMQRSTAEASAEPDGSIRMECRQSVRLLVPAAGDAKASDLQAGTSGSLLRRGSGNDIGPASERALRATSLPDENSTACIEYSLHPASSPLTIEVEVGIFSKCADHQISLLSPHADNHCPTSCSSLVCSMHHPSSANQRLKS